MTPAAAVPVAPTEDAPRGDEQEADTVEAG